MIFSTVISVFLAGFCWLFYYLALPALTLSSAGFWWFIVLCLTCITISALSFAYFKDNGKIAAVPAIVTGVVLVLTIVLLISSSGMCQSTKAQAVASVKVSQETIQEAFPDLSKGENLTELPLVDLDTAKMLGDKKLAGIKNAPWYEVDDDYHLIKYQGKFYWISNIDYGGFLKYRRAKDSGIPGYVLVEATPENGVVTQEASIVVLEEPIRFSPGAYFGKDLRRHLRSQFRSYVFDESHFEINEEGTPFWITGVLRPTAGVFGVRTEESFILTNAQTGESKEYKVENAPDWIDHVYDLEYLMKRADWHYSYVNGFWNAQFSQTGVLKTSYRFRDQNSSSNTEAGKFANFFGYSSIVGKDGKIQFYTGLTAANNAESNLGWLTIDTRTGKITQYDVVGAEESSAQAAVETLVQAEKYESTFPLPTNIGGKASYLMLLKGKSGLAQGYAICNMENFSIAVKGDTLDKVIVAYLNKLGGNEEFVPQESPEKDSQKDTLNAKSRIDAIYTAEIGGTTYFYYSFNGELYRAAVTVNEMQVTFMGGDIVTYDYYLTENGLPQITKINK